MGDSICDIMMKEHEKFLKTHTVIHACSHKPKTPYQLDLEVKDRKPDIVPKVGDKVKIKSREWYEKWKGSDWWISFSSTDCYFAKDMAKLCGKTFTVTSVEDTESGERWCLGSQNYYFVPEMFEEVYPQESSKEEKIAIAFDYPSIKASALGEQLAAASFIPEINPIQGIGIATDWGKITSDTSAVTALPRSVEADILDIENRLKKLCSKQPELQTIKKHRFSRLENL